MSMSYRDDAPRACAARTRYRVHGLIAIVLAALLVSGAPGRASAGENVAVLYAGSLVNLMERGIGPAFERASGDHFQGFAGGSKLLANEIRGRLRRGDVFVSANPAVNNRLMGTSNGRWVSWYISFAQSPLVIGYNPSSRFAGELRRKPWYEVLQEPGFRLGRTDPKLDPKGELTEVLMRRAGRLYGIVGLARRILGSPENPAQVLPEETLVGRLQSGQIDAGIFYSTEVAAAGIPALRLPAAITPKARYTVTILRNAPHPRAATAFVAFLLGPQGRALMRAHGLDVQKAKFAGKTRALPPSLRAFLKQ